MGRKKAGLAVLENPVEAPLPVTLVDLCADLVSLQRQRTIILKSRNMQSNRLQAIVAGTIGYSTKLAEKERAKKFSEASKLIKDVAEGKASSPLKSVILTTLVGINQFNDLKSELEKQMTKRAKLLPVAEWVGQPEQRGFGLLFLAIIIGETGNLTHTGFNEESKPIGYPNPAKLVRRLCCAPWTFEGQTLMGATWRSGRLGKLPASEWEKYGYSPRRRSISYLIGEGIVKQNFLPGLRGLENQEAYAGQEVLVQETADVVPHENLDPSVSSDFDEVQASEVETENQTERAGLNGQMASEDQSKVAGRIPGPYRAIYDRRKPYFKRMHSDATDQHIHRDAMLVATKELLIRLWSVWNNRDPYVKPKWPR